MTAFAASSNLTAVSGRVTLRPPPYALYRRIRRDPTIALVRSFINAAVVDTPWSINAMDDAPAGAVELIQKEMNRWRDILVEQAALAGVDFGWAAWEIIGEVKGGDWRFKKLKALLQDITTIKLTRGDGLAIGSGELSHLEQPSRFGRPLRLEPEEVMLISWRVEGSNLYGEPLLINAREVFQSWTATERAAHRYDTKIAGTQVVVHFPPGEGLDVNGNTKSNAELAADILKTLESAGTLALQNPNYAPSLLPGAAANDIPAGWSVEILKNPNAKPEFNARLGYLDKLKVRALGFPERAVLEASSGTRADATAHASFAILNLEQMGKHIARDINLQLVDRSLEENYGPEARGTVVLVSGLLQDRHKAFLANLATDILKTPQGIAMADWDAILDQLNIPKSSEVLDTVATME